MILAFVAVYFQPLLLYGRILFISSISLFFMLTPVSVIENGERICLIYKYFGTECPGCGMTRAFSNLFHLDMMKAIDFNKGILFYFPLMALIFFLDLSYCIYSFWQAKRFR